MKVLGRVFRGKFVTGLRFSALTRRVISPMLSPCTVYHVIVLNERHLKRLMSEYVLYYHEDRTHLGLAKDTPAGRPTAIRSGAESKIQSLSRLGGLHHRYAIAA